MQKVIVIAGPTASGKTDLGIALAKAIDGEIISADSAQVYRYMNIGTAKPTLEEREGIPHHMIDIVDPDEAFSVAQYKEGAEACIREILGRGRVPVVVGGTGLYINALVYNIQFSETICNWDFREKMRLMAETHGPKFLHDRLKSVDPESAARIHANNIKRVIRALEVYETTGKPISQHQAESRQQPPAFDYQLFGLHMEREWLISRIDRRVDRMMEDGLVSEVQSILDRGYARDLVSLQAIGYKEIIAYLHKECTLPEAIDTLKLGTRHLAKRQMTWFKSVEGLVWLDIKGPESSGNVKNISRCLDK